MSRVDVDAARVAVVGAGYVGLVTAVGLVRLGHRVVLVEADRRRLNMLDARRSPIHEPGVQEALDDDAVLDRLRVSDALPADPDVVMICVGTPIGADGRSDLSQLRSALAAVDRALSSAAPVVIRSTLPPGSSQSVASWTKVPTPRLLINPEFLRQGTALQDFLSPTRIVIGHFPDVRREAIEIVLSLFASLDAPRLVVDVAAAELIKNGANAFLALKLSFANEIAAMCEEYGTDAGSVLEGIGLDPRIGRTYMRPSFGFGGSCLPKELQAMTAAGRERGLPMHVTAAASEANLSSQRRFVRRVADMLGGLTGQRIALLGLAYKAGTDDVRESPAVAVARMLLEAGATVSAYDPAAGPNAKEQLPQLQVTTSPAAAIEAADAILITTDWPEFASLDWAALRSTVSGPTVVDGRRALDPVTMRGLGYRYVAVGTATEASTPASRDPPAA